MRKLMYGALALVIIGVVGVIMSINTSGAEAFTFSSVGVHQSKEASAEGIRNVRIESPTVDVKLVSTNGDKIEAEFSGKAGKKSKNLYKLDMAKDGNTLKITMDKEDKFQFMMFNFTKVELNVKVPEKVYDSIEIKAASGDINLEEIQGKVITIETQSGDIKATDAVAEDHFVLHASSGDIVASENRSNQMEFVTSSGDITINNNEAKGTDLVTSSGDIVSGNTVSEDIKMNTSSGDIVAKMKEMKGNVELEASSGDIDVSFTKSPTSLKVDYKTSSGDGIAHLDEMNYSEKSEHRIVGKIGDGKVTLTARTSSGDFTIR
ncbi:DUF4097 family beta strand repeat-containing protein [Neobacillus sp. Marseille-QA0830]